MATPKPSEHSQGNWISRLSFWWIVPLLKLGNKTNLTPDDFHVLPHKYSSKELGNRLTKHWATECQKPNPKLSYAVYHTFKLEYLKIVLLLGFRDIICRVGQGVCVCAVLNYFDNYFTHVIGISAGVTLVALVLISGTITQQIYFKAFVLGMQMRIALISITYNKCFRLSQINQSKLSELTSMISNDVNRFDRFMFSMCSLFVTPIQFVVVLAILWPYIGPSALAGLAIFFILIVLQMAIGRLYNTIRHSAAHETDARVLQTTELINGIQWIKMATLESVFAVNIEAARGRELVHVGRTHNLMLSSLCLGDIALKLSQFVVLYLDDLNGQPISAVKVFVLCILIMYLGTSASANYSMALSGYFESLACLERIEAVMMWQEKQSQPELFLDQMSSDNDSAMLELTNVCSSWSPRIELVVSGLTLRLGRGQFIGVVGPVGSGKSSILKTVLREIQIDYGEIKIRTPKVAYVSQEPWIFPASLVDNIVLGKAFNEAWFLKVVEACALQRDIKLMKNGVNTFLGDRGVALSGGQKARINLARAVYADADLYLLDDPLSGVDVSVSKFIGTSCIRGLLKSKAILLVTHQVQHLKDATEILVLNNGRVESRGSFDEIIGPVDSEMDVVDDLEPEDNSANYLKEKEVRKSSKAYGTFTPSKTTLEIEEDQTIGKLNVSLYWKYLTAAGFMYFLSLVILFIVAQGFSSVADIWLKIWAKQKEHTPGSVIIYLELIIGFAFCTAYRNVIFGEVINKLSQVIHSRLLASILRAPVRFFQINTAGRILNRFVNDMGVVDDFIPAMCLLTLNPLFQGIGCLATTGLVLPLTIVPAILLLISFGATRQFYIRAASNLKRLEALTRSPVFGMIGSTVAGLVTIRASNLMEAMGQEYNKLQDRNSAANLAYLGATRWFAFCLDCTCAIYAILVVLCCYCTPNIDAASAGLAIMCALTLTAYASQCSTNFVNLEGGIISVERILEYTNIEAEADNIIPGNRPASNWPKEGRIEFDNCFVYYGSESPVLNSISLRIKPGETVGIVGRTGAGKSTLISCLFRLVELHSGSIFIDAMDVSKIGLQDLRSKISIIPQHPVLFIGSLRQNLDPFSRFSDMKLMKTLHKVNFALRFQGENGLDAMIAGGGENLSHGERQLLCLARAMLERTKILVLDEATAHVDDKTDSRMQNILRTEFKHRTIITVAHRLSTVMDNDKILVLGDGKILEFDHPHNLLQEPNGYLFKLSQKAGPRMFENFLEIAKKSYNRKMLAERLLMP